MTKNREQKVLSMIKFIANKTNRKIYNDEIACDSLPKKISFTKVVDSRKYLSQDDIKILERKLRI